jgi:hypothetical protein
VERLQPRDLGLRKRLRAHVGERRAPPQGERRPQGRGRLARLVCGQLPPSALEERLEPVRVERIGPDPHAVAAAAGANDVAADRRAEPRCDDLHGVSGVGRRRLAPKRVDDLVGRDDRTRADEEQAEQARGIPARHASFAASAEIDLERPKDAEPGAHAGTGYPPG